MEDINDSLNPVTKDAVPVDKTAAEAQGVEPAPAGTETKVPADTGAATPAPKKKKKKKKKLPPKVIVVENLGVRFRIQEQKVDSLKEYFVMLIKRRLNYKEFWAL